MLCFGSKSELHIDIHHLHWHFLQPPF